MIAIIMLLSTVHNAFLQRMIVRAELDHLYAVCSMLQRSAMMFHQSQTLSFDKEKHRYRYKQTEYCLPASVRFGTRAGVKGPPSAPDYVIINPITFKEDGITFTPDGIIQPGAVYLTDHAKQCTYALSCAIAHVSHLRKYQYTDTWHNI
jgi:hypothetical protein